MSDNPDSNSPLASDPVEEPAQAPLLNIANVLTVLRICLVPVFIWLYLQGTDPMRFAATGVFILASWTDQLDGHLARSRNLITNFGKIADPIADKALTLSAFILLSVGGMLWWWVTILIIVRELGITVMRFFMLRRAVMAASRGGKLKTVLQITALVGLLTPWGMFLPASIAQVILWLAYAIVGAALVVTVMSGLDYVRQAVQISHQADGDAGTTGTAGTQA